VAEAAESVGLPRRLVADLDARYVELQPWPDVQRILSTIAAAGLTTYWHDRIGMAAPEGVPIPLSHEPSLDPLLPLVLEVRHQG